MPASRIPRVTSFWKPKGTSRRAIRLPANRSQFHGFTVCRRNSRPERHELVVELALGRSSNDPPPSEGQEIRYGLQWSRDMSVSDIVRAGRLSSDVNILKAEFKAGHRVRERIFLTEFIPSGSTGAELGVFTGLFSASIARQKQISCVTFVDPWWKAYGDYYPDWGPYTNFGRVSTRKAYQLAKRRISSANLPNRFVEVASSYDWLTDQRDESLDWVYLDTTHTYEGTKRELGLLDRKLKKQA